MAPTDQDAGCAHIQESGKVSLEGSHEVQQVAGTASAKAPSWELGQRGTGRDGGGEGSSQGAPFMLDHRASLPSTRAVRAERRVSYRPTSRSARTAPPPASSAAGAARPAASSAVAAGSSTGSDWGLGDWEVPEGTAAFRRWLTLTLLQGRLGGAFAAGELTLTTLPVDITPRTSDCGDPCLFIFRV